MARLLEIPGDGPLVDRDRAILELLYSSGLRLAELTDLDVDDVDRREATVRVTGKGNKDRIVPVGSRALDALAKWQVSRVAIAEPEEQALFVSNRGTRLSRRSVQARVDHWARRQGIDTRVYPHLFRHSFATHLLESSHDLRGVQELLGHANISTTQVYTHLDFQHLAQIYDRTHPRARSKDKP
jgi:integrase/recombinase XerC